MTNSLKSKNASLASSVDRVATDKSIIQCPACATRFAIDSRILEIDTSQRFHCSRCDVVFSSEEASPPRPVLRAVSKDAAPNENVLSQHAAYPEISKSVTRSKSVTTKSAPHESFANASAHDIISAEKNFSALHTRPALTQSFDTLARPLSRDIEEQVFTGHNKVDRTYQTQPMEAVNDVAATQAEFSFVSAAETTKATSGQKRFDELTRFRGPLPRREMFDVSEPAVSDRVDAKWDNEETPTTTRKVAHTQALHSETLVTKRTPASNETQSTPKINPVRQFFHTSKLGAPVQAATTTTAKNVNTPPNQVEGYEAARRDLPNKPHPHAGRHFMRPQATGAVFFIAPALATLVFLIGFMFYSLSTPHTAQEIVAALSPYSPQLPPDGLHIESTSFRKMTLDSGDTVYLITGQIRNESQHTYKNVQVEGQIFSTKGMLLGNTRTNAASTLASTRIRSLTTSMIREIQTNRPTPRFQLTPGESHEFVVALLPQQLTPEWQNAAFFSARIHSVVNAL
jgi:predicted Zn finger-like uncharacterized protein